MENRIPHTKILVTAGVLFGVTILSATTTPKVATDTFSSSDVVIRQAAKVAPTQATSKDPAWLAASAKLQQAVSASTTAINNANQALQAAINAAKDAGVNVTSTTTAYQVNWATIKSSSIKDILAANTINLALLKQAIADIQAKTSGDAATITAATTSYTTAMAAYTTANQQYQADNQAYTNAQAQLNALVAQAKVLGVTVNKTTAQAYHKDADAAADLNQQIINFKNAIASFQATVAVNNELAAQYAQAISAYNTQLAQYNSDLAAWKKANAGALNQQSGVTDANGNSLTYSQLHDNQQLHFGNETNATTTFSGYDTNNATFYNNIGTDQNGKDNYGDHGQRLTDSKFQAALIFNDPTDYNGNQLTVTYDNLQDTTYRGQRITKIVATFSNIVYEKQSSHTALLNDESHNPLYGFWYVNIDSIVVDYTFYDANGNQLTFGNDAYIAASSLNNTIPKGKALDANGNGNHIEKATLNSAGNAYGFDGMSVTVHDSNGNDDPNGKTVYADKDNDDGGNGTDLHVPSQWAGWNTNQNNLIHGAGLFQVTGSDVQIMYNVTRTDTDSNTAVWIMNLTDIPVPHVAPFTDPVPVAPTAPTYLTPAASVDTHDVTTNEAPVINPASGKEPSKKTPTPVKPHQPSTSGTKTTPTGSVPTKVQPNQVTPVVAATSHHETGHVIKSAVASFDSGVPTLPKTDMQDNQTSRVIGLTLLTGVIASG